MTTTTRTMEAFSSSPGAAIINPSKCDHFLHQYLVCWRGHGLMSCLSIQWKFSTFPIKKSNCSNSHTTTTTADSTIASGVNSNEEPEQIKAPRKSALKQQSYPNRLPQQTRIWFQQRVQQRGHFGRHEYTTEELLDACWFRGEEYQQITRSCCKDIQRLKEQQQQQQQKVCCGNHDHDDAKRRYQQDQEEEH